MNMGGKNDNKFLMIKIAKLIWFDRECWNSTMNMSIEDIVMYQKAVIPTIKRKWKSRTRNWTLVL